MAEQARSRAPHLGPKRRRPLVLDAAADAFAQAGFGATSMASIAARMDIAKAVLYDCFPGGKHELHRAVLRRSSQRFRRSVVDQLRASRGTLPHIVRAALGSFVAHAETDPSGFALLFGGAGTTDVKVLTAISGARARALADFSTLCAANLGIGMWSEPLQLTITAIAHELARRKAINPMFDAGSAAAAVTDLLLNGAGARTLGAGEVG